MRGDVRDGGGLARSVGGKPGCSTQVSGRAHCMATRRASLGHIDLATHPGAGMLDRPDAVVGPSAEPTRKGQERALRTKYGQVIDVLLSERSTR